MPELLIKIKRDERPDPAFQDGDIMCAMNELHIKNTHAQLLCHKNLIGFNGDGLRPENSLTEMYLASVKQYKFQRVSNTEVKRIDLATLKEETLSGTPNAKGEYIDVDLYISRRLQHDKHLIFGTEDNEIWYGGRTLITTATHITVWNGIESTSLHREVNYTKWPWTDAEMRNYLVLTVDDFDNDTRATLEESVYNQLSLDNEILKKRHHKVDWKNLASLGVTESNILDKDLKIDIRDSVDFLRSSIVEIKP